MAATINTEKLRCSNCNGYLSFPPIMVLHDGRSVCSRCVPSYKETELSRELVLEEIISDVRFPCIFEANAKLLFGHVLSHEQSCSYRNVECPLISLGTCPWKGPILGIGNHFINKHPNKFLESKRYTLAINQDLKELFVIVENKIPFIILFAHSAANKTLRYDIMYYRLKVINTRCTMWLTNSKEKQYRIPVECSKCTAYEYKNKVANILNLSSYLEVLRNPKEIIIEFELVATELVSKLEVDYQLLEKIRCTVCRNLVVPPIYKSLKGIVCCRIDHNCTLSDDQHLKALIKEANYPCRWRQCSFIGNCSNIREHEKLCKFRLYRCFTDTIGYSCSTKAIFTRCKFVEHLTGHGFQIFVESYVLKTDFRVFSSEINNYAIIDTNGEFVILNIKRSTSAKRSVHRFIARTSGVKSTEFTLCATYEHLHCSLKSQNFMFFPDGNFTDRYVDDLPTCFRADDEMTVTVKVIQKK